MLWNMANPRKVGGLRFGILFKNSRLLFNKFVQTQRSQSYWRSDGTLSRNIICYLAKKATVSNRGGEGGFDEGEGECLVGMCVPLKQLMALPAYGNGRCNFIYVYVILIFWQLAIGSTRLIARSIDKLGNWDIGCRQQSMSPHEYLAVKEPINQSWI